jgi:hypothetical protein
MTEEFIPVLASPTSGKSLWEIKYFSKDEIKDFNKIQSQFGNLYQLYLYKTGEFVYTFYAYKRSDQYNCYRNNNISYTRLKEAIKRCKQSENNFHIVKSDPKGNILFIEDDELDCK